MQTRVAAPLKDAKNIIRKALENPDGLQSGTKSISSSATQPGATPQSEELNKTFSVKDFLHDLKRHFLTGISYMIPLVIAGAVIMGIARIGGSIYSIDNIWDDSYAHSSSTIIQLLHTMDGVGGIALGLMLPFISGFIAFSIAEKPGLVPGFVGGILAKNLNTGFLGALIAGVVAGYLVKLVLTKIRLPGYLSGISSILIAPVFATLGTALLMLYLIGDPVAALNKGLETWLMGLNGGNKILLAALIGAMVGFDLGGPVNKAAVTTAMALLASGITTPNTAAQVAIIVPPLGLGLATLIASRKYSETLREAGKSSLLMGFVGISEGAIPFAIESPLKVIPVNMLGCAIASALAVGLGANNAAPISGFYGWFIVEHWPVYVLSIAVGAVIIAVLNSFVRKSIV